MNSPVCSNQSSRPLTADDIIKQKKKQKLLQAGGAAPRQKPRQNPGLDQRQNLGQQAGTTPGPLPLPTASVQRQARPHAAGLSKSNHRRKSNAMAGCVQGDHVALSMPLHCLQVHVPMLLG